jgi:hypothetical protein
MSDPHREARIVVISMWTEPSREGSDAIRLRIVDRAHLPPSQRETIAVADVEAGLTQLSRILRAFADGARRAGDG